MVTALYIGTEKLDLFEDDNITIKNSVSKIEDITKVFTETSNSFSVPATDNNNKIFKHYYNASIKNPFDARKLVLGAIYLDGLHYKSGNFKLNSVKIKGQKADSYSLDFFGLLTQLKELIRKDKLSALDLTAFDYDYTYANVKENLRLNKTSGNPKSIVNTILTSKRCIYNTNSSVNNTEFINNIAFNNTGTNSGLPWHEVSTSILNIKIIEAIESKYNLTFSRDFLGTASFNELYLLLNGGDNSSIFEQQIVFDVFKSDPSLENDKILLSTNKPYSETNILRISINLEGVNTDSFTSIIKSNGIEINRIEGQGRSSDGLFVYLVYKSDFTSFENLTFHLQSNKDVYFKYTVDRNKGALQSYKSERASARIKSEFIISEKVPDITIIEYLKGMFQVFKLIVIPISETNIFIDTSDNYYRNGINRDVTKFIDFEEVNISTGKILNEINYKFQESSTILAQKFRDITGVDYGNLELKITDSNGELIDGDSLNIELPFENMIYENLTDLSGETGLTAFYGFLADINLNPVKIKSHLHYVNQLGVPGSSISNVIVKILSAGSYDEIDSLNAPSHRLGFSNSLFSTVFGSELAEDTGETIINTLYTNYHKTFIQSSFNVKKRKYSYNLKNVSLDLIRNLKLNDNIIIKGRAYRIDSLDTNITTKEINLNLINL